MGMSIISITYLRLMLSIENIIRTHRWDIILLSVFDADFDGEDELLVNDFGMDRQGNSYTVFDITAKGLYRKDYLPFAEIDNETEFYPAVGTIVLYAHDGVHDSSWSTFRKRQNRKRRKTLLVPDRLADATSGRLLQNITNRGRRTSNLLRFSRLLRFGNKTAVKWGFDLCLRSY